MTDSTATRHDQPTDPGSGVNPMQAFADAGWEFNYDEDTRFIGAAHPLGGAFSICEVSRFVRSGGRNPITFHELGHAIAAWLNQKSKVPA